ncbi:MAG: LapA family protein [Anaerolineales bacterium]|nr:LapA family protein [Anaerolineales bacterium]
MRPILAFILAILVLLIVFFLQNTEAVDVEFLFFDMNISLALVIIISMLVGVVFGIVMPRTLKPRAENFKLEENIKRLAEDQETAK